MLYKRRGSSSYTFALLPASNRSRIYTTYEIIKIMTRKGKYDDFIIANYKTMTVKQLMAATGMWQLSIYNACKRLKVKPMRAKNGMAKDFTVVDEFIKTNSGKMSPNEMAEALNVKPYVIYYRCRMLLISEQPAAHELTYSQICSGLYCIITGYKIDKYA